MPVSIDQIFRDAADRRITWQEALTMTVMIDEDGNLHEPNTDIEKHRLVQKVFVLRHFVKTDNDPTLQKYAKLLDRWTN